MAEDKAKVEKTNDKAAERKPGLDSPIEDPGDPSKVPAHIHPDTLMVKGIAPDSKQRVAINLEALKYEFGEKKGLQLYKKIGQVGGFLDLNSIPVGDSFAPDFSLEGLKKDVREQIDAILKEA